MSASQSSTSKKIAVAVVGVGLVGKAFVDQLLAFTPPDVFRIVALSSSKALVYNPDGLPISASTWQSEMSETGSLVRLKPDLTFLARELCALVRPGQDVVLVDNTSSNDVAQMYPVFLRASVHVVTPNKKAFSGELELYEEILQASLEGGARFLNESTVGAGLPVISTLKDLVATGDKVSSEIPGCYHFCSLFLCYDVYVLHQTQTC